MVSESLLGMGDERREAYDTAMLTMTTTQSLQIFLRALQGQSNVVVD
jgi:hypothetical protein